MDFSELDLDFQIQIRPSVSTLFPFLIVVGGGGMGGENKENVKQLKIINQRKAKDNL